MKELEKQIIGKWVEIKEKARDVYALEEYFALPAASLQQEAGRLSGSVEEGVIEYKRKLLNHLFRTLADIKYKSFNLEVFQELIGQVNVFVYVLLIQRLLALGLLRLDNQSPEEVISTDKIEINLILKDILARIKEDPEFAKTTPVKNILVQFSIYKNERETLKKLSASNKGKTSAFYDNFKATFEKVFSSIRRNYAQILRAEAAEQVKGNVLAELQDKHLAALLYAQIKEMCQILSTLEFVHAEKYKTREVLIKLLDGQGESYALLEKEKRFYEGFAAERQGGEKLALEIAVSFAKEVARQLQKQLE